MKNCDISLLFLLTQIAGTQLGAVLTSIQYLCFWVVKRKVVNAPVNYTVCMSVRLYVRPEKFVLNITMKRVVL